MRMWQSAMIGLAGNERLARWMHACRWTASLAQRFVSGGSRAAAWRAVAALRAQGALASLYYLGEYVTSPALVARNVEEILATIARGDPTRDASSTLCVDPTQIGYSISDTLGWDNARRIGHALRERGTFRFLMIDMEDESLVDRSLDLYRRLRAQDVPVAITLQAYLRRTDADVSRLATEGGAIRLCKGAFVGTRRSSWSSRRDVDAAYLRHARTLLSPAARDAGSLPILATHDRRMIETLRPDIEGNGWSPGQYEIEMLLGVRETLRQDLIAIGHTVRVYVPFGSEWWPYTVRRIGERPANARFVAHALLRR